MQSPFGCFTCQTLNPSSKCSFGQYVAVWSWQCQLGTYMRFDCVLAQLSFSVVQFRKSCNHVLPQSIHFGQLYWQACFYMKLIVFLFLPLQHRLALYAQNGFPDYKSNLKDVHRFMIWLNMSRSDGHSVHVDTLFGINYICSHLFPSFDIMFLQVYLHFTFYFIFWFKNYFQTLNWTTPNCHKFFVLFQNIIFQYYDEEECPLILTSNDYYLVSNCYLKLYI